MLKPGFQLVGDVDEWEDIKFPDLDNRDWEAAAARDTAGWDRKNRFSIVQMLSLIHIYCISGYDWVPSGFSVKFYGISYRGYSGEHIIVENVN